jgi:hypothetical protein
MIAAHMSQVLTSQSSRISIRLGAMPLLNELTHAAQLVPVSLSIPYTPGHHNMATRITPLPSSWSLRTSRAAAATAPPPTSPGTATNLRLALHLLVLTARSVDNCTPAEDSMTAAKVTRGRTTTYVYLG